MNKSFFAAVAALALLPLAQAHASDIMCSVARAGQMCIPDNKADRPVPKQTERTETGCGFDGKDSCGFTTPARSEQVNAPPTPDQAANTLASITAAIPLQMAYPSTNVVPGSAAAEASATRCVMEADAGDIEAQVKCARIISKWLYANTPMLVGEADMIGAAFIAKAEARALRVPRGDEPIEFDSDAKRLIYQINKQCPKSLNTEAAFRCRDQIRDLDD